MLYGTITYLGDSIAEGARGKVGTPEYLAGLLNSDDSMIEWSTINYGISGQTTWEILRRTHSAARELAGFPGSRFFIIQAGTNDSKGMGLDFDLWKSIYTQMVAWPRRYEIPIILCTYPPVDRADMPVFTDYSNDWLKSAGKFVKQLAADLDCQPSPIYVADMSGLGDELVDGVHLTDAGYYKAAKIIADIIKARTA